MLTFFLKGENLFILLQCSVSSRTSTHLWSLTVRHSDTGGQSFGRRQQRLLKRQK